MKWLYSLPPLLTLCCFMCLAALTFYRGAKTKTNRLFLMICLLASLLYGAILLEFNAPSEKVALFISRIDHLFIVFLTPLYLHFFYEYLHLTKYRWLVKAAYVYTAALVAIVPSSLFVAGMEKHAFGYFAQAGILYPLFGFGGLAVTISSLLFILVGIRREQDATRKNRLSYVMFGFAIMGLLTGLNFLPIHGIPIYPPGNFSFIPLSVFAVGLFKHDLLDMGILIKKSLVYSLLTALLTGLYAVIVIIANQAFAEFIFADSIVFPICFFFIITFIFGPLKNGIQRLVDRLFFKPPYDYRATLKDLSRRIVSELDMKTIGGQLLAAIEGAMQVNRIALLIHFEKRETIFNFKRMTVDQPDMMPETSTGFKALLRYLTSRPQPLNREELARESSFPEIAGALAWLEKESGSIVFPLFFQDHINGLLVMGAKRSGERYTREDIDLLETLCTQSALAIENARSYEKVEVLNAHLEQKVVERTAALNEALLEKEKTQEQLIRSESLAAIGQLVAGVAHELNNPLAGAISLIQTAVEDLDEMRDRHVGIDEATLEDLTFAEKELLRARDIVRSLLDLSRQTEGYDETVNLNEVIKDATKILFNQYKQRNIPITQNFGEDLPPIKGNFAALGQVAVNIIQNAIQAMENQEGIISLSTHHDVHEKQIIFQCSDSGNGIPREHQKDIFKPFFTTKEVGQGTGLGLYLCHEIVKKHFGQLAFSSREGQGTHFTVRLPATA